MPIAKNITDMQSAAFDQLVAAQAKIVEVNKELAARLGDVSDKIPALPLVDEALEANRTLVDNLFTWSTKLIETNRAFTDELMRAWLPAQKPVVKSAK